MYPFVFLICVFLIWLYPQKYLKVKTYDILENKGEVFLVLSDMHNNCLLPFSSFERIIKKEKPSAFLLLGDLIDRNGGYKNTKRLLDIIHKQKVPVYFVRGNHEISSPYKDQLQEDLKAMGALCLENIITSQGELLLSGFAYRKQAETRADIYLCHNPMDALKGDFPGLYLAGHTHGGMVRFPIIGTFYVPDQEYFPKYQKGLYELSDRKILITSGIGNTFLPLRFLNPIEVMILR
ncbi:MAG: hypothetical protein GX046_02560 [Tissierellia bacterium]|nr:hypothetical protein [Tissierellia bacterium]